MQNFMTYRMLSQKTKHKDKSPNKQTISNLNNDDKRVIQI